MDKEIRSLQVETRAFQEEDGKRYLAGRPIVYNKESRLIPGRDNKTGNVKIFREKILPGALTEVLNKEDLNVRAVWMHERGQLLGTSKSGTLSLTEDENGVEMRLLVPNTSLGNDIYELVSRGDITEMSFKFALGKRENETWAETSTGEPLRVISRIGWLGDVSFVDQGAYSDTSVAIRSLEEFEKNLESEEKEKEKEEQERKEEDSDSENPEYISLTQLI